MCLLHFGSITQALKWPHLTLMLWQIQKAKNSATLFSRSFLRPNYTYLTVFIWYSKIYGIGEHLFFYLPTYSHEALNHTKVTIKSLKTKLYTIEQ
jgi:hypothetical protein